MGRITFTTTATNRPDILDRTYGSFNDNIVGLSLKDCELIINIDPLPDGDNIDTVVDVASKYFKNVTAITPKEANFTTAINTIWDHAKSDFIFHLEDDWILREKVDLNSIIKKLDDNPKMVQCVLRAYKYKYDKMALSPSVIKKRLYSHIAGKLNVNLNPEIQLRDLKVTKYKFYSNTIGVYGNNPVVEDIGRDWIEKSGFRRPDKKAHFNSWVKK